MAAEPLRIYPTQYWFLGQGGQGTVTLVAPDSLTWTVSTSEAWLTPTSSASGQGSAQLTYEVAPNPGGDRHGTLSIAGLELRVLQLPLPQRQERQVLRAPLTYIEQVGLQGFLDKANKLPPPARLAAYAALFGAVEATAMGGKALYAAEPQVPQTYTAQFINQQLLLAVEFIGLSMGSGEREGD
jgi:hypothetical protein